jgi:predicted nucleotidyltransferase
LVTVRAVGNRKHYQANPDSPIFHELCGIARKTVGLAEPLRVALEPFGSRIRWAFVFGSVAKQVDTAQSDIDLMVLSDTVGYGDLFLALEAVGERLGRMVNPTIYTQKDYARRVKSGESFLTRVLAQPKVWLIGGESDLRV